MRYDPFITGTPAPAGLAPDPAAIAFAMVSQAPRDPRLRLVLWRELAAAGRLDEAGHQIDAALEIVGDDADAVAALATLVVKMGGFEDADALFAHALTIRPDAYHALLGHAAMAARRGERVAAAAWQAEAATAMPLEAPAGAGPAVLRVRCLRTARYEVAKTAHGFAMRFMGGHLPTRLLPMPEERPAYIANLLGDARVLEDAPRPTLLVNTIACPDRGADSLEALGRYLAERPGVAAVNRPDAVLRTRPDQAAARLGSTPGVRFAPVWRIVAGEPLAADAIDWPVVVRPVGGEAALVDGADALAAVLDACPRGTVAYAHRFEDTRDACGVHRKGRAAFVGGTLHPVALLGGPGWCVRCRDRDLLPQGEALIAEERDFLADPAAVIGARRWSALGALCRATTLDYVAVDFAPTADGVLVLALSADRSIGGEPTEALAAAMARLVERKLP